MRNSYLVAALLAVQHANAIEVNDAKKDAFSAKQETPNATDDFTQANCQTDNDYYVSQLPGFSGQASTWPCSYAGTLPGNEDKTHQLFFWMYPATDADAPVTIWLNGGPGASSTFANFLFSSPLRIAQPDPTVGTYSMTVSEDTWITQTTMIYIDQPVGTGFSFGTPLLTTMDEAADEFINLMNGIMTTFPELASKDLYVTGESYAGKYIPRFSWALHEAGNFNLKASLVGDPYTAPLTQRTSMHIVPEALNILDDSNMPQIAALRRNCQEELAKDLAQSADTCAAIMDYISEVSGDVFPYDQRIFSRDWDVIENPVVNYFTTQAVPADLTSIFAKINVSDSTKEPVFEMSSGAVGNAFVLDNLLDYSSYVEKLIDAGSPVLIYAGEFDAQDGPKTQEFWLRRMKFSGSEDFWSQSRSIYWVQDTAVSPTVDLVNGGYWRTSDYFEYLTVPKAGHFVPNNYYSPSYAFLSDYIASKKLICHKSDGEQCSVVKSRCEAMNQCNGHGSCGIVTGQCVCDAGYKFADCSAKVIDLTDGKSEDISSYGPGWVTMQYSGKETSRLYISPNITSEVYILKDKTGDPNNFVYDMSFKSVSGNTTFAASDLGMTGDNGFSVAVYVPAVDEGANKLLYGGLNIFFSEDSGAAANFGVAMTTLVALAEITLF